MIYVPEIKFIQNNLIIFSAALFSFILELFFALLTPSVNATEEQKPIIVINQIINHIALNKQNEGILAALKEAGYTLEKDISVISEDSQGSIVIANQIAKKFSALSPSVAVGISTPAAQTLMPVMERIQVPLVYTAVSDPESARLTKNPDAITGVSCKVSISEQINLIQKILPNARTIGVVFNPGEINAANMAQEIQENAEKKGLIVVKASATKTNDVRAATESLVEKVDVILLCDDNTVASAIDMVLAVTLPAKIPVFSSDQTLIEKGVLCGLAVDHFELGKQAGHQVVRLLKGEKVQDIRPESPKNIVFTGNKKTAKTLGIELPEEITWVNPS